MKKIKPIVVKHKPLKEPAPKLEKIVMKSKGKGWLKSAKVGR